MRLGYEMANPQVENGYTKIANEILDALIAYRLPGEQMQVLLCIIRASYGWNEKEAPITHQQISEQTGINRPNVARAIKGLLSKKIAGCIKSDSKGCKVLIFNKDHDEWVPNKKRDTSIKKDSKSAIKIDTNKGAAPINRKKRKKTSKLEVSPDAVRLTEYLIKYILKNNSKYKFRGDLKKWPIHIDRMLRIDGRTVDDIKKIIEFCQKHTFWMSNILSTQKLREKYDQLYLQMINNGIQSGRANQKQPEYFGTPTNLDKY